MIVNELSKELGLKNKEVIEFFKSNGYKVSSHMQSISNEMVDLAREKLTAKKQEEVKQDAKPVEKVKPKVPARKIKKFAPDDQIPCRSLVPWRLIDVGVDKSTVYTWSGYGHIEYVSFRDL